jgi:hypothetical protein
MKRAQKSRNTARGMYYTRNMNHMFVRARCCVSVPVQSGTCGAHVPTLPSRHSSHQKSTNT